MNEVAKLEAGVDPGIQAAGISVTELFVINLCASMTPMPAVPKNLKGFEKYKLYQVSRQEDGRRRFRLRLGFFTSEADAEWVLNSVRSLYPTAFTGCVTQEDLRYVNDAGAAALRPVGNGAANASPVSNNAPAIKTSPISASIAIPAPSAPIPTTKAPLTLETAKPAVNNQEAQKTPQNNQPFHVARGVQLPETHLELTDEFAIPAALKKAEPVNPSTKASALQPEKPAVQNQRQKQPATASHANVTNSVANAPIRSASIVNAPKVIDDYVPILDTTLTIRTLTQTEADDPNRPKWFVVQLALSEQPINLETMPKLDIFAAYNLYSVALMEGGGIKHALRLGFFRENVSAEAVMGYLKAFFSAPRISQISTAEYERFAEKPKPKPVTETQGEAKVVKLNDKRPASPGTPAITAMTQQRTASTLSKTATAPKADRAKEFKSRTPVPAKPQSFLSRLIGRQLD
ncbi:MAG: hypothetical protein AB7T07_11960 [Steroidobacteraceae bacterium]